jgi:hypothetical protein
VVHSPLAKQEILSDKNVREKGALRKVTAHLQENLLRNARYFFSDFRVVIAADLIS